MYHPEGRYIYFIREGNIGPIKIGMSTDPVFRMLYLQKCFKYSRLNLLGVLPEKTGTDRRIHAKFAALRLRGEWFKPEPELLTYISANATLDIPDLNLGRLEKGRKRQAQKRRPAPRAVTIWGIRHIIRYSLEYPRERHPLDGIYQIKDQVLFSKYQLHFYYEVCDTYVYDGQTWGFVKPLSKHGRSLTENVRGRGCNWYPLEALEKIADRIEPPIRKTHRMGLSEDRRAFLIQRAKQILRLLADGLTQVETAQRLRTTQSYVSAIKLGKHKRYRHLLGA